MKAQQTGILDSYTKIKNLAKGCPLVVKVLVIFLKRLIVYKPSLSALLQGFNVCRLCCSLSALTTQNIYSRLTFYMWECPTLILQKVFQSSCVVGKFHC